MKAISIFKKYQYIWDLLHPATQQLLHLLLLLQMLLAIIQPLLSLLLPATHHSLLLNNLYPHRPLIHNLDLVILPIMSHRHKEDIQFLLVRLLFLSIAPTAKCLTQSNRPA
jgi:hypothetical protein